MSNPWLANNPFLSMWMSAANRVMGTARGHAMNEARRQQQAMINEGTRAMMAFWSGAAVTSPKKKNTRRRK